MTIQGFLLLHHMKKVQNNPTDLVEVNVFTNTLETSNTNLNDRLYVYLNGRLTWNYWSKHLRFAAEDLAESGYTVLMSGDLSGNCVYSITSKGHYVFQHFFGALIQFLLKSIATPIIVSILTTYITLKVFGQI